MQAKSGLTAWEPGDPGHKVLALEHSLVARRGDFLDAFEALSLLDPDSVPSPMQTATPPDLRQFRCSCGK